MTEAWNLVLKQVGPVDYLKRWIATMLYKPFEPTDYLYLYGPPTGGKTMFQRALSLLTQDAIWADNLFDHRILNEELATAILCKIEEVNVKNYPEKMNEWVHRKWITIYTRQGTKRILNKTHWIQCSNDEQGCPNYGFKLYMDTIARPCHGALLLGGLKSEIPRFKAQLNNYL